MYRLHFPSQTNREKVSDLPMKRVLEIKQIEIGAVSEFQ